MWTDAKPVTGMSNRFCIIGNSGSGKSTLARRIASAGDIAVLDLDTVFWVPGCAEARDPRERVADVRRFCERHASWVIEGCYADLAEATLDWMPELVFIDPGVDVCLARCRARPHEPHKFRSKEEQDAHLEALLAWVADYYHRDGLMSHRSHAALFEKYNGPKRRVVEEFPDGWGFAMPSVRWRTEA
jgi:adenylate kinase family enzyme